MTRFLLTRRLARRLAAPLVAAAGLLTSAAPASAGWDNVFQVVCHDCKNRGSSSYYADPTPAPAPADRRVEYQRSYYYEPVTVMKPERYTEEVPVQVKSYYWDPVTTYTRSSYYDPCTGCRQDICVPRTSYVRKEQCSTTMKVVERMRMVPVQVQRKIEVTRPVVTYYLPEQRRYVPDCELPDATGSGGTAPAAPPGPRVEVLPGTSPSVTPDDRITPQRLPVTEQSRPKAPASVRPAGTVNAHTTGRQLDGVVRGEVVQADQVTPRPGAKLVFVRADDLDRREYAVADAFGGFDTKLAAGDWYVYLGNGDGKATLYKKITVADADAREFKVVSR